MWLLAAALTPALVARRLLQHQVVTLQTIMGAVAAYLQIAVAYAFLYQTIDAYSATDFFGKDTSTTTYMYFSLVTISTVGYGDFVAVSELRQDGLRERGGAWGRSSSSPSWRSSCHASGHTCRWGGTRTTISGPTTKRETQFATDADGET